MLPLPVVEHVDFLMLSEIKLDSIFSSTRFLINSFFVPHRFDRSSKGSGILL